MTSLTPSDQLTAAVLADAVYHSASETITPPPGWVQISTSYNKDTGYYGEAWGKTVDANGNPLPVGQYAEIMQVNRGTVMTAPAAGTPLIGDTFDNDQLKTVETDAEIVLSNDVTGHYMPSYADQAVGFFGTIQQQFPGVPVVEVGQSLGGFTSDAVTAWAQTNAPAAGVTAFTFNALPLTDDMAKAWIGDGYQGVTSGSVTNNYVGNELLTQNVFVGTAIGNNVTLPDLPVDGPAVLNALTIHSAGAAVAQIYASLYGSGGTNAIAALQWLAARYPDPTMAPEPVKALLQGATVKDSAAAGETAVNPTDGIPDDWGQVTATIGDSKITIITPSSSNENANTVSQFAVIQSTGTGAPSSSVTISTVSVTTQFDAAGTQYMRIGDSDQGVAVQNGGVVANLSYTGASVVATDGTSSVVSLLTPSVSGTLAAIGTFDPTQGEVAVSKGGDGSVSYSQTVGGVTTSITLEDAGVAAAAVKTVSVDGQGVTSSSVYNADGTGSSVILQSDGAWSIGAIAAGSPSYYLSGVTSAPTFDPQTGNLNVSTAQGGFTFNPASGVVTVTGASVSATVGGMPTTIDIADGFAVQNDNGTLKTVSVTTSTDTDGTQYVQIGDGGTGVTVRDGVVTGTLSSVGDEIVSTDIVSGAVTVLAPDGIGTLAAVGSFDPTLGAVTETANADGSVTYSQTIGDVTTNLTFNADDSKLAAVMTRIDDGNDQTSIVTYYKDGNGTVSSQEYTFSGVTSVPTVTGDGSLIIPAADGFSYTLDPISGVVGLPGTSVSSYEANGDGLTVGLSDGFAVKSSTEGGGMTFSVVETSVKEKAQGAFEVDFTGSDQGILLQNGAQIATVTTGQDYSLYDYGDHQAIAVTGGGSTEVRTIVGTVESDGNDITEYKLSDGTGVQVKGGSLYATVQYGDGYSTVTPLDGSGDITVATPGVDFTVSTPDGGSEDIRISSSGSVIVAESAASGSVTSETAEAAPSAPATQASLNSGDLQGTASYYAAQVADAQELTGQSISFASRQEDEVADLAGDPGTDGLEADGSYSTASAIAAVYAAASVQNSQSAQYTEAFIETVSKQLGISIDGVGTLLANGATVLASLSAIENAYDHPSIRTIAAAMYQGVQAGITFDSDFKTMAADAMGLTSQEVQTSTGVVTLTPEDQIDNLLQGAGAALSVVGAIENPTPQTVVSAGLQVYNALQIGDPIPGVNAIASAIGFVENPDVESGINTVLYTAAAIPGPQQPFFVVAAVVATVVETVVDFFTGGKPIVLDMTGQGINLTSVSSSDAYYDLAGTGAREHVGWVGSGNAFLVYDPSGSSTISQRDQLSFVDYKAGALTDLQGLVAFDTNGDGKLDAADADWSSFKIWQPGTDGTGGELESLSQAGIASIDLSSDGVTRQSGGNTIYGEGTFTYTDGRTGTFADVGLGTDGKTEAALPETVLSTTAAAGVDDPLVLNLVGGQVHTTALSGTTVAYDINGTGSAVPTGWILPDEGFLVIDAHGNGIIDSGSEMIRSFAQLEQYDISGRGVIDASNPIFSQLRVWVDKNGDGISETNELYTLEQLGITSINLNAATTGSYDNGNQIAAISTFTYSDGTTGQIAAVSLANGASSDGASTVVTNNGATVTRLSSGETVEYLNSVQGQLFDATGSGVDVIVGGSGANTLAAGSANGIVLMAGTGGDTLIGGQGASTLIADGYGTSVFGGVGQTTVKVSGSGNSVTDQHGQTTISMGDNAQMDFNGQSDTLIAGNGDDLALSGNDNTVSIDNGTIRLASGRQVSISKSALGFDGNTVSGTGNVITLDQGTVSMDNWSESVTLAGSQDRVSVGDGDTLSLTGDENVVATTGTDDAITVSGVVNSIALDGGDLTLANSGQASVSGKDDLISLGANDTLSLSGDDDAISAGGNGDSLSVSGSGDGVIMSNGAIAVASGGEISVTGAGNAISLGADDYLAVKGNDDSITASGENDSIVFSGLSGGVAMSHSGLQIGDDGTVVVTGNGNDVTVGINDTVSITGGNNIIVAGDAGDIVSLDGSDNTLSISNGTVEFADGSEVAVSSSGFATEGTQVTGANNRLVVNRGTVDMLGSLSLSIGATASAIVLADGDAVSIVGDDNSVAAVGPNDSVTISGVSETISIDDGSVSVCDGGQAAVIGADDCVSAGSAAVVSVTGNSDQITISGAGDTLGLLGTGDIASMSNGSVEFTDRAQVTVTASAVNAVGNVVNGTNDGVLVNQGAISVANGATTAVIGSADDISLGAGSVLAVVGNGDTVTATGAGDTLSLSGMGDVASMSGGTVEFVDGAQVTVGATGISAVGNLVSGTGNAIRVNKGTVVLADGIGSTTVSGLADGVALGSGDTLSLIGDDDAVTATGSGDTVTVSGVADTAALSNGILSLADDSQVTLSGSNDRIFAGSRDNLTVIGDNDTVFASGMQDTVTSIGVNDQVSMSNGTVGFADGSAVSVGLNGIDVSGVTVCGVNNGILVDKGTIFLADGVETFVNGASNGISLGADDSVSLSGDNDVVMASGARDQVGVAGTGELVTLSGGSVSLADGGKATVNGNGDAIAMGTDAILSLSGANDAITASGAGDMISLYGSGDTAVISNGTVAFADGADLTMTASGISGGGMAVTGRNNIVNLSRGGLAAADGLAVTVDGSSDGITLGTGDTVTLNGFNESVTANGSGDTVLFTGTGDAASISNGTIGFADGTQLSLSATGISASGIIINGSGDGVMLNQGAISVAGGVKTSVTGNTDTIVLGAGGTLSVSGNGDSVATSGSGDNLGVSGRGDSASLSGGSVSLGDNSQLTLTGSSDRLVLGTSDTLLVTGGNDSAVASGTGDMIGLYGTGDTAVISDGIVGFVNGTQVTVAANGVSGGGVSASGVNDGAMVSQGSVVVNDNLTTSIVGSADAITVGNGVAATVSGDNNQLSIDTINVGLVVTGQGNKAIFTYDPEGVFTNNSLNMSNGFVQIGYYCMNTIDGSNLSVEIDGVVNYDDDVTPPDTGCTLTGINDSVTMTYATITVGDDSQVAFSGADSTITSGAGDTLSVTGDDNSVLLSEDGTVSVLGNNEYVSAGSGGAVYISGSNEMLGLGKATGAIASNSQVSFSGYENALIIGANVTLTGNSDVQNCITAQGTGDSLIFSNSVGDVAALSGGSVTIQGASRVEVTGAGDNVTIAGLGNAVAIVGDNNSVADKNVNANDVIQISGNGDSAAVSGETLIVGEGSQLAVSGSGDDISLGSGASLSVTGNNDVITASGAGDMVGISGTGESISLSDGSIGVTSGNQVTVTSSGMSGAWGSVTGTNDSVQVSSGGVSVAAGVTTSVTGALNKITLAASDILSVIGNSDNVVAGGAGDMVVFTGTGDTAAISNGTVGFANGAQVTVTANSMSGGGVTVSGSNDDVVVNGGAVSVIGGLSLGISGNSDTITLGANDAVLVTGSGDTMTATGSGVSLNLFGSSDAAVLSNGTVTLADQSQAALNGSGDAVTLGAGDILSVTGAGDQVVATGAGDTLEFFGSGDTASLNDGTVGFADGALVTVGVSGVSAAGITVTGANDRVMVNKGSVSVANGVSTAVSGSLDGIALGGGDSLTVSGTGDSVVAGGVGDTVVLVGTGNAVVINDGTVGFAGGVEVSVTASSVSGAGNTVNGARNAVMENTGLISVADETDVGLTGDSDSVVLGSDDTVSLTGCDDGIDAVGAGDVVTISGRNETVALNRGTLTLADDSQVSLVGSNDKIVVGASASLTVSGENDTIVATGVQDTITTLGLADQLVVSNGVVGFADGAHVTLTADGMADGYLTLVGSGDAVLVDDGVVSVADELSAVVQGASDSIVLGIADSLILAGSGDVVTAMGADDTVIVTGSGGILAINGGMVSIHDNAQATVVGANDAVVLGGDAILWLTGAGDTVSAMGAADTVYLWGSNDTVTGSDVRVGFSDGAQVTVSADGVSSAGGTASGADDTVLLNKGGLSVAAGALATISGASDLISLNANASISLSGTGDSVSAETGDAITVNGDGDSVMVGGANDNVDIDGSDAVVTLAGNDVAVVAGDDENITASGTGDNLSLSGTGETAEMSGAGIQLAAGGEMTLSGSDDTITAGFGSVLYVSGSNDVINAQGDCVIVVTGANDTISSGAGSSVTVTGSNNNIFTIGDVTVTGEGNQIAESGWLTLSGTGNTVSATLLNYVIPAGNTFNVMDGEYNNIYLNKDIGKVSGYIYNSNISAEVASGENVNISGSWDGVRFLGNNSDGYVSGNYDLMQVSSISVSQLTGIYLNISGWYDSVIAFTDGMNLSVSGQYDYISIDGNYNNIVGNNLNIELYGNKNIFSVNYSYIDLHANAGCDNYMSGNFDVLQIDETDSSASLISVSGSNNDVKLTYNAIISVNGASNELTFESGISDDQLWFSKQGNNLLISVLGKGQTDQVTNWYSDADSQFAAIRTQDGHELLAGQVDNLVNAMSAFSAQTVGATYLSANQVGTLEKVIAANWR